LKKLLLIFLAATSFLSAGEESDLLFVGFDAGETQIWIQVLNHWEQAPDHAVLTMGTASKIARESGLSDLIDVADLGVDCPPHQRLRELSVKDLKKISSLAPSILVTGMYSTPQRQIAELFARQGSAIIAVWDNFSTYDKLPPELTANVERIVQVADVILVPSSEIVDDLNTRYSMSRAIAFGHPTLDQWREKIAQVDLIAAWEKTGFQENLPIITYISGYEEKGNHYNESFSLFAQSLIALKKPIQLIVQLHPRSDGSFEKAMLEQLAAEYPDFPPFIISDGKVLSTFEAIALADLGVCHRSTVAIQALFSGKRCMHIDVPGTPFSHFAIQNGLMAQCLSNEEATKYIEEQGSAPIDIDALYEQAGILPQSTTLYRYFLKTICDDEFNLEPSIPVHHQMSRDSLTR
jgi:hypothetical protein